MGIIANAKDKISLKIAEVIVGQKKSFEGLWSVLVGNRRFGEKLLQPYEQLATVYMAIKILGENANQINPQFYNKNNDKVVPFKSLDPQLQKLFKNPNPLMSWGELLEATVIFYKIYGESFWQFSQSIGQQAGTSRLPSEIWCFNPRNYREIITRDDPSYPVLTGWKYKDDPLTIDEVVHFKDFNPLYEFRGLSPLKPLEKIIDVDWLSLVYAKSFYEHDGTPGLMLGTDKELSPDTVNRMRAWWDHRHAGASKAFKTAILEGGLKPVNVPSSQRNQQYIENRQYLREEILGVFRVPKAMFAITEGLNYATFAGQKRVFWEDTLIPMMTRLTQEMNSQFCDKYLPGMYIKFDYSQVISLQEQLSDKLDVVERLVKLGYTINQANIRMEMNMPTVPWGDVAWMAAGMIPISGPTLPLNGGDHPDNAPKPPAPLTQGNPESDTALNPAEPHNNESKTKALEAYKNFFIIKQTQIETQMQGKIKSYFFEQRKRVLDNLNRKSRKDQNISINWGAETDKFKTVVEPYIADGVQYGANQAKNATPVDVNQDVMDGKLSSYIATSVEDTASIIENWGNKINSTVVSMISQGSTTAEIADAIKNLYNQTGTKSRMIARTESTGAINGGTSTYLNTAGIPKKKWLTANDEHVRETHSECQDQGAIDNGEAFSNGLQYPGDDGPPEEVINCRCTLVGVME